MSISSIPFQWRRTRDMMSFTEQYLRWGSWTHTLNFICPLTFKSWTLCFTRKDVVVECLEPFALLEKMSWWNALHSGKACSVTMHHKLMEPQKWPSPVLFYAQVMPTDVEWIKEKCLTFQPEQNKITLASGHEIDPWPLNAPGMMWSRPCEWPRLFQLFPNYFQLFPNYSHREKTREGNN